MYKRGFTANSKQSLVTFKLKMDELKIHRTIAYLLLLLAALSSTTLGLAVKRQSDSECLFQYVLQPPRDNFNICNPFQPAENSLTLECSILVMDSRPGELTIDWIYTSTGDRTETLLSNTTATSLGTLVYSTITIANTRAGHYYCQPNSTQAGLLKSSSQTTVFSKPLYVVIDNSCEGQQLSTEQPECILNGNSLSGTTTTELSNSETSAEPTIDPPENHNILYKSLGGVGLLLIVIVVCTGLIVCCHHKRTSRSRVPNSQGKGSRVVREWHAVRTTQTSPQPLNDVVTRQYIPPPHTLPPVLASMERDSRLTSSGYVDANSTLAEHRIQYQNYSSIIQTNRDDQSEWSQQEQPRAQKLAKSTLPASYTPHNIDQQYVNYRQPHGNVPLEPIYEDGNKNPTQQLKERVKASQEEAYSEVGNTEHLYQGLVPETMNYTSLYHMVNKN
ncbi:uncharacterized protein LOC135330920 [Halichondria panicea]|uniref:uncharacterized protein LOC135330920 n=1 Tax=Halichondria panicea TaxID=6063 RepID=UPI00312B4AD9